MPYLQLDGVNVVALNDDVASALKSMVDLHGVGEQQGAGVAGTFDAEAAEHQRWIAAEMSIGIVFWKDRKNAATL